VGGQLRAPVALPPEVRALGTPWIGGRVGPKAGMDAVAERKILIFAFAGNRTLVVQTVA